MGKMESFDAAKSLGWRRGRQLARPGWRHRSGPSGGTIFLLALATFAGVFGVLDWVDAPTASASPEPVALATASAEIAAPDRRFGICVGQVRINCLVDGDTIWMAGEKIRLLDIDTPELHPSRCAEEERLGLAAKDRLRGLLNSGRVTLAHGDAPDRDRYGRLLRTVSVSGAPVGDILIAEGLARPYGNGRRSWCG